MRPNILLLLINLIAFTITAQKQKKPKLSVAESYLNDGEYSDAIGEIERATNYEKLKDSQKTWWLRARIYMTIDTANAAVVDNPLDKAIASFKKTEELGETTKLNLITNTIITYDGLKDSYWAYYFQIGSESFNTKDFESALDAFTSAQKLKPSDSNGYFNASLAAHNLEKWDIAKKNYQLAIDNGAKLDQLYLLYSTAILASEDNEEGYEKALKVIQDGKKNHPDNADLVKNEFSIYLKLGKMDEAKSNIEKQLESEPDNSRLYFNLGVLEEELGNKEASKKAYEASIEKDPEYYDAYYNLAAMLINDANTVYKEYTQLGMSDEDIKKADEMKPGIDAKMKVALKNWEKLYELKKSERITLETILFLYNYFRDYDKAEQIQAELDQL